MPKASEKHTKDRVSPLVEARLGKLADLQSLGVNPYATGFRPTIQAGEFRLQYEGKAGPDGLDETVWMAGRIMALRVMGKASFIKLRDESGDFQAYVSKASVGDDAYRLIKKLDVGDIVGLVGKPFTTRTGELSILTERLMMLTKSLRPLPEKWHGLSDVEIRYRQRYVDLIVNPRTREIIRRRSRIIHFLREFLTARGFLEVETPMMQAIPGGATARPFETYHHALDMNLYLRIAPELYLKRLLVGGLERVFEINRNFRNEGISTNHNPEFTMLEFYEAYATYHELMNLTEEMIVGLLKEFNGDHRLEYGGRNLDFTPPWKRMTVREALVVYAGLDEGDLENREVLVDRARRIGLDVTSTMTVGQLWMEIFDETVEHQLWQPVFVHQYPVEVSPLARKNEEDPAVTDRFELYIAGKEVANAFTELNDPIDQRERFEAQVKARAAGDDEAHFLDADFLRALEHGMPPAAGEGVGIDRLVMLLTDSQSIREVIVFPHMRPEKETE